MAAIYFDLDGTLLQYDRGFDRIFTLAFERVGVDVPPEAVGTYTATFRAAFDSLDPDPYRDGVRAVVRKFDLEGEDSTPVDVSALVEALLTVERESLSVPDGARDALLALGAEHDLGVLTNGIGDVQRAKLDHHGLRDYFDVVLISHDLGVMKPDPELFVIARERIGESPYVYVGDDSEEDILPAEQLGFTTVQVVDGDESDRSPADLTIRPEEFDRIVEVL